MTKKALLVSLVLAAAGLSGASCEAYVGPSGDEPGTQQTQLYGCGQWEDAGFPCISIWTPDDPDLPRSEIMGGCDMWADIGLKCVFVDEDGRDRADVEIYSNGVKCVPRKDGLVTLALAYWDGMIVSFPECMQKDDDLDLREFRNVIGHELGHSLGIWDHVPAKCDDPDVKRHSDGPLICGPALMNPLIHKDLERITSMDWLAYDMRDTATPSAPATLDDEVMDEAVAEPE